MVHEQVWKHPNILETSTAIPAQTDWVSAAEVGLLLPRGPTESYWCGSWPCGSSAPCGDRTQASFLSLDLRSAPPGPIPRLSEPAPWVSSGLAGCSPLAPGCLLGSAWTAAASRHQQTSKLVGPVFPHGLDGGACSQSIGVIPPKQPHPVHGGRPKKEDFFFHVPSHFKDSFSSCLKFLNGAPCFRFITRGHSSLLLDLYYFTEMLWLVFLRSIFWEAEKRWLWIQSPGSEFWLWGLWSVTSALWGDVRLCKWGS